jgi:hypothetical protein
LGPKRGTNCFLPDNGYHSTKLIDVFSQYKFLNPEIFGQSFYVFRNRYFDMVGYGNHTPVAEEVNGTGFDA